MQKWTFRILVHLVSLLIVMPLGWCCWLPSVAAEPAQEQTENCCCGPKKPAKPAIPAQPSEEKPEPPSCCCDSLPVALVDNAVGKIDVKPLAVFAFPAADFFVNDNGAGVSWLHLPLLRAQTPPLHVLHCIWLC